MDKQFPWGIVASLVVIAAVSTGGGYLLYRIIDGSQPIKAGVTRSSQVSAPAPAENTLVVPTAAGTPGFLVIQMRAAAEMSPDTGQPSFDVALENQGFATDCPGKVVGSDHRSQKKDFWTSDEGATAETESVVCLPALSTVSTADFPGETAAGRVTVDDTEASEFPDEIFQTRGRSVYVQTGTANYMLYAGGISGKRCKDECEGGVAVGVGVTRVGRPLSEDRFVFSLPMGDSRELNVAASAPMAQ